MNHIGNMPNSSNDVSTIAEKLRWISYHVKPTYGDCGGHGGEAHQGVRRELHVCRGKDLTLTDKGWR